MIDWIMRMQDLLLLIYLIAVAISLLGYLITQTKRLRADLNRRKRYLDPHNDLSYYHADVTVGSLVGRFLLSWIPVVNLWPAALFTGKAIVWFLGRCADAMDIPLVKLPKRGDKS